MKSQVLTGPVVDKKQWCETLSAAAERNEDIEFLIYLVYVLWSNAFRRWNKNIKR